MKIFNYTFTRSKNVLPEERLAVVRLSSLKQCDYVIDVGSNKGQWISKLRKNGYRGPALCIEPSKQNFNLLSNLEKKFPTQFENVAVGNYEGEAEMNVASNNGLSSSLLELSDLHLLGDSSIFMTHKEKVKVMKLSSLMSNLEYKNIYLKIDTQGYEFEVLKSINSKNWSKISVIEIELNLVRTYRGAPLFEEVIKFLRNKNFSPIRLENGFGLKNFGQILQMDAIFVKMGSSKSN